MFVICVIFVSQKLKIVFYTEILQLIKKYFGIAPTDNLIFKLKNLTCTMRKKWLILIPKYHKYEQKYEKSEQAHLLSIKCY